MKNVKILMTAILLMIASVTFAQRADRNQSEYFDTDNVQTIKGTVSSVNHPISIIKSDDGKEYEMHMGPFWYWNQNDFELNNNASVEIKGEVKERNGIYELYPWTIIQNGKTMSFADDKGVPNWSGGRGKGNWRGKGYGWQRGWGRGNCRNWCPRYQR